MTLWKWSTKYFKSSSQPLTSTTKLTGKMRNPFSSPGLLGNNLGSSPFVLILNMSKDSSRGGKKWKIWSKPIVTIKGARSFSARRLGAGLAYRCDSLTVNPGEEQKSVHWLLPVVVCCVFILNVCAAPTVSLRACGAAFFYPPFLLRPGQI